MDVKLLKLLSSNARYTTHELAVMSGLSEDEVELNMRELCDAGIIRGYKTVIDWERLDNAYVSALIELKVVPQDDYGFEKIAENVAKYSEAEAVYLMSGSYDLTVIVKGKTFQEVAMFVAKELATMQGVSATATHFILRRYKEFDVALVNNEKDERGTYLL